MKDHLESLSREQLMELAEISAKSLVALDGVWFQAVEQSAGMDAAMDRDEEAWQRFPKSEARLCKGMGLHPCKRAGMPEYGELARAVDPRIACECISCYPDQTLPDCGCAWRFTLEDSLASEWGERDRPLTTAAPTAEYN